MLPHLTARQTQDVESIKSTLIHGDFWEGNTGTDAETGNTYVFDACSFYAHYKTGLGMRRKALHEINTKALSKGTPKRMEPSKPAEKEDARGAG
ncbi:hypothetical protein CIRG_03346 [Coccidioides immitis RMSCC 2394]|uniref:Protein-ribulosamine 3-kinase n=1 Tax=Coccidioides immitis RMSCC 2394 TaxID=404692 RepID=A0A0J6YA46_COCIT|nr:hypothetical protein CIRG_03346 [Coccidioides immitis RMSCC 2394]